MNYTRLYADNDLKLCFFGVPKSTKHVLFMVVCGARNKVAIFVVVERVGVNVNFDDGHGV